MYNNNMKLEIKKIGINGEGIAYINKKPIFVEGAFPSEIVEADIYQDKQKYMLAKPKYFYQKASYRRPCKAIHEEKLGYPFYSIKYEKQLAFKLALLKEALWKYAHVKDIWVRKINPADNEFAYRNQCKLPVQEKDGQLVCGLYSPKTNHFKCVHDFLSHDHNLEKVRKKVLQILNQYQIKAYSSKTKKGIRYLVIRSIQQQVQVTLITGNDLLSPCLIEKLSHIPCLNALYQSIQTKKKTTSFFGQQIKLLSSQKDPIFTFGHLKIQLSPISFFQLNTAQALKLYTYAISKIDPCETLVEAYCGIGVMSLLAFAKAKNIYGIECNPKAIENAKKNADLNNIKNIQFYCDDAVNGLFKIAKHKNIDCLLLDPPRTGLDDNMLQAILKSKPKRIIYISCNPATLAKNISVLKKLYQILTIQAFDMFPQTPHVESVVLMSKVQK